MGPLRRVSASAAWVCELVWCWGVWWWGNDGRGWGKRMRAGLGGIPSHAFCGCATCVGQVLWQDPPKNPRLFVLPSAHPPPPSPRYDVALERVVRQRYRKGRQFPLMTVIPPGLDFSALKVKGHAAFMTFLDINPHTHLHARVHKPTTPPFTRVHIYTHTSTTHTYTTHTHTP